MNLHELSETPQNFSFQKNSIHNLRITYLLRDQRNVNDCSNGKFFDVKVRHYGSCVKSTLSKFQLYKTLGQFVASSKLLRDFTKGFKPANCRLRRFRVK